MSIDTLQTVDFVIPAQAGIQSARENDDAMRSGLRPLFWIPAYAGMTTGQFYSKRLPG